MPLFLPLVLATSLTTGTFSNNSAVASATIINTISNQAVIGYNKLSNSDVFIPYYDSTWNSSMREDRYDFPSRSNERYDQATPLVDTFDHDFRLKKHFRTSVSANLSPDKVRMNDYDFYYFDLFSDSTVSLSIDIASISDDYFLSFEKLTYWGIVGNVASKKLDSLASYKPGEEKKNFSLSETPSSQSASYNGVLDAGTYYFSIQSTCNVSDNSFPVIDYVLNLEVTCLDNTGIYEISDLRYNKGIGAVMWCSDLRPIGMFKPSTVKTTRNSFVEIGDIQYQKTSNYFSDPYRDHALETLQEDSHGESLLTDCLYIWDRDVADGVLSSIREVEDTLKRKYKSIKKTKEEIQIAIKVVDTVAQIVFTGLEIAGITGPIVLAINCLEKSVLDIVQSVLDWSLAGVSAAMDGEEVLSALGEMIYMLSQVRMALQVKVGNINSGFSGDYGDTIAIPLTYYSLFDDGNPVTGINKMVKFENFFSSTNNENYNPLYFDTKLYSCPEENLFCGGKFYAFGNSDTGLLKDVNECGDVLRTPKVYSEDYLNFEHSTEERLYTGDYSWYSFTAPEDAVYLFRVDTDPWPQNGLDNKSIVPVTYAVIEAFWQVEAGQKNHGFTMSDYYQISDEAYFSYLDYPLSAGQTIYLRVEGNNYDAISMTFIIKKIVNPSDNPYHVHTGTKYVDNGGNHSLVCWNDDAVMKTNNHDYSDELFYENGTSYRTCLHCHHKIEYRKYEYDDYHSNER